MKIKLTFERTMIQRASMEVIVSDESTLELLKGFQTSEWLGPWHQNLADLGNAVVRLRSFEVNDEE